MIQRKRKFRNRMAKAKAALFVLGGYPPRGGNRFQLVEALQYFSN